ncbi:MAG TPA: hypothetical protein VFV10_19420 [Gammaproteobacteria bacterium]|nr:hypothetical protein [Gammaproteobacteria bacterium]
MERSRSKEARNDSFARRIRSAFGCVVTVVAVAVSLGLGAPAGAGEPEANAAAATDGVGAERPFDWAYAAAFGTGTYQLGEDSTVSVVRLPLHATLHKPNSGRGCACGIRLLFPVTIGVENFDLEDLESLPERTNEFGFFPGVEVELPRTEHWTLKIQAQIGEGVRVDGERERTRLYGAGIRSRYVWPKAPGRPSIVNGLYWSAFRPVDDAENAGTQDLARFSSGLEFNVSVPRWRFHDAGMHLMPHVLAAWYFRPVEIEPILSGEAVDLEREWEVGLAAGPDRGFSILRAKFDRVGIAFRHSANSRGIRLYVGSIF